MPNWCENVLTIRGPQSLVTAWVQAMQGASVAWPDAPDDDAATTLLPLCFHRGVPIPADIVRLGFSPAGYNWCLRHWGTKWEPDGPADVPDVSFHSDGSATACYVFDTAWSPPIAWLHTVAAQWPGLTFSLVYGEPGTQAYGDYLWLGGQCVQDTIIDPDTDTAWITEHFGTPWDEASDSYPPA